MELPSYIISENMEVVSQIVSLGLCSEDQRTSRTSLELLDDLPLNMSFLKNLSQMDPISSSGDQFLEDWCWALNTPSLNDKKSYIGLKHMMGLLLIKDIKTHDEVHV